MYCQLRWLLLLLQGVASSRPERNSRTERLQARRWVLLPAMVAVAGSRVVVRCLAPKLTEVALPFQFQASRWYHVVITHSTGSALSSSFIRMFVDGNLEASSRFKYAKVPTLRVAAVAARHAQCGVCAVEF